MLQPTYCFSEIEFVVAVTPASVAFKEALKFLQEHT